MKTLLVSCILLSFFGCDSNVEKEKPNSLVNQAKQIDNNYIKYGITVQTIDSCEYILVKTNDGIGVIHKQNCKYCKLRNSNK